MCLLINEQRGPEHQLLPALRFADPTTERSLHSIPALCTRVRGRAGSRSFVHGVVQVIRFPSSATAGLARWPRRTRMAHQRTQTQAAVVGAAAMDWTRAGNPPPAEPLEVPKAEPVISTKGKHTKRPRPRKGLGKGPSCTLGENIWICRQVIHRTTTHLHCTSFLPSCCQAAGEGGIWIW